MPIIIGAIATQPSEIFKSAFISGVFKAVTADPITHVPNPIWVARSIML